MFWMNLAFSQPVVRIWGSEDPQTVKKQVEQYLDQLDVRENVYISVGFSTEMPKKLEGMAISLNSPEPDDYQIIKVLIDASLSKMKQRLVLAHEMIHVKQYVKEELVVLNKQQVMWKGQKYHFSCVCNRQIPWEKEAYRTDNLLVKLSQEQTKTLQDETDMTLAELIPENNTVTSQEVCKSGKC